MEPYRVVIKHQDRASLTKGSVSRAVEFAYIENTASTVLRKRDAHFEPNKRYVIIDGDCVEKSPGGLLSSQQTRLLR